MQPLQRLARELRRNQTPAEYRLWIHIKNRQLNGVKFKRQVPIGKYIADFVALQQKLIIELDGGHHNEDVYKKKDDERTKFLEMKGYTVLRFWNNDVMDNLEGVLEQIHLTLVSI